MSMPRTKMKVVWGAVERQGNRTWSRVGYAWETLEGEIVGQLHAVPLSGRIAIRGAEEEAPAVALVAEEALR